MMWMGSKPGTYRAEGAYGQITLVDPSLDIITSTTECSPKPPASQETMDRIWEFLEEIDPDVDALPEDTEASGALARKLSQLNMIDFLFAVRVPFCALSPHNRLYVPSRRIPRHGRRTERFYRGLYQGVGD